MASFNKVIVMGNLGQDVEIKHTQGGTAVCEISLACTRKWKGGDGQMKEETVWVPVTLWGRQAEIAGEYLGKGKPVLIEGRLTMDSWEDKDSGKKRTRMKVTAESLQLLGGGKGGGGGNSNRGEESQEPRGNSNTNTGTNSSYYGGDEEIPF